NGELVTLEQRQVATFGPDTPAPDPTPLGPPVRERVLPAHDAFCMPDELRRSGRLVIDPASPPDFLTSKGATPAEVATAVEQVRKLVVDWVEASERAGDASLAQEVVCVGLFDDVKGANSMAVGGNWLLVGIRDLYTMYGVHGGDGLGAVEFTVGHELGHILQQKAGMVFPGPTVRGAEVHADCMAGYLMGIAVPPGTTSPAQAYARTEVHRVGDRAVDNPGHHGTPEERTTAFERGWAAGSIAQQGSQGLQQTTTMLKVCSLFAP
ncbi:MAG: hypothetical protein KC656_12875, partial [Myxococcales bacterium]|nr:hypothetical protein [Myxococcales bacterium]